MGTAPARAPLSPGMGFAGLSFVVNVLVVLTSAVITSRLYGVEVVGQYALAMSPWLLLVSLSTVSEQIALVRTLAPIPRGSDEATGLFFAVLTLSAGLTAAMSVPVTVVTTAVLRGPAGQPESVLPAIAIVAGYVLLENPGWNLDSVLSAYSQGRRLFWCRLATVLTYLFSSIALFWVTTSVWGLALANIISFAVGLVARSFAVRGFIGRRPTFEHYRAGLRRLADLLRFGVRLLPGQLLMGMTLQAPLWIISGSAPIAQVGAFSRASTMAVRLNEASFRINEMLFPDLVRLQREGDTRAFTDTLERSLRLALGCLLLPAAVAGGAAGPVMSIFGDGFSTAAGAVVFLFLAHVIYVATAIVASAYNAMGSPHLTSSFSAIRCTVALSAAALLVDRYGIEVAAAGIFAGYAIELAAQILTLRRTIGLAPTQVLHPSTIVRLLACYGGSFVVARMIAEKVSSSMLALPLAVAAGAVVFGGIAVVSNIVDAHDRQAVRGRLGRLATGGAPRLPADGARPRR